MVLEYIKNLRKTIAEDAGFTMIELLVVISVIGVLAVAVLSSINPIEQINKGRDTRTRSDAAQLINAIDRYVAIQEAYPWNSDIGTYVTTATTDDFDEEFIMAETNWNTANVDGWSDYLTQTSEVKDGFLARQRTEQSLYVIKPAGYDENTYICFIPTSNAFRQEAAQDCDASTTPPGKNASIETATTATVGICGTTDGTLGTAATPNYICLP